jgi:hypothetical protein
MESGSCKICGARILYLETKARINFGGAPPPVQKDDLCPKCWMKTHQGEAMPQLPGWEYDLHKSADVMVLPIRELLQRLARLLDKFEQSSWALSLKKLADELAADPTHAKATIRSLYGGLGSFNDIILQRDGKMPAAENEEFDALRSELFLACRD